MSTWVFVIPPIFIIYIMYNVCCTIGLFSWYGVEVFRDKWSDVLIMELFYALYECTWLYMTIFLWYNANMIIFCWCCDWKSFMMRNIIIFWSIYTTLEIYGKLTKTCKILVLLNNSTRISTWKHCLFQALEVWLVNVFPLCIQ